MTARSLFHRAAALGRAVLPATALAAVALTCDAPTSLRRTGSVAVAPVFGAVSLSGFAGLSVDSVRVTIVRPPQEVLLTRTVPFSPDSQSVSAQMEVSLNDSHERLLVRLDFIAGALVMFTGQDTVDVVGGVSTTPAPIPVSFVGPGTSIAWLQVGPRDSGTTFGASVPFTVAAYDSLEQQVSQFYVSWSTDSSSGNTINAAGLFRAGTTRGWAWVRARTPTGIRDSVRILVAPVPSALQAVSGGGQTAPAGTTLPQPLVAKVIAADGLPVVGVPVTFTAPSGASVSPASGVTDTLGQVATVATLGPSVGTQTFGASSAGLAGVSFSATSTSAAASQLAFTVGPSSTVAGVAMTPAVQVTARDGQGNTATSFTGVVTVALGSNPTGDSLAGTTSVAAVAGVATFNSLSLAKAAAGYTLVATSGTLTAATSASFLVIAAAADTLLLVSGDSQTALPGTALPAPVVVRVLDAFGNPVAGSIVSFAVASGGGSTGATADTTDAAGDASTTWTLGATGAQALEVTAAGLAGSPLTVTAVFASGVAGTTVTPAVDTITALTDTTTLTAQARDALGDPVAGTFTWLSLDTNIATVSAAGLVTAKANGTTGIVATEAGGTADTAQVTVQQRVATINVTPANRSIYLGGSWQYIAGAVDGKGFLIDGYGPYTWSSTATAVATVDSTGLVTGVGLGNAQIRAQAGAIIGVANVAVLTPITRIVVAAGAGSTTDTATLTSLGVTRTYRAIAHDTLDAVMTGVAFTWQSTNPSVAGLDSVTDTTARATAAANGVTTMRASAQGVTSTPGALLTVSQVLSSIELSPPPANPTATIAVSGTINLTARGKDANDRYIASGIYRFASATPAVATVDSVTGIVTGVSTGTSAITAHDTTGTIVSNVVTVTVGGAVPAVISFGRDTLSVGRGSSASIPILLSRPDTAPMIVKLVAADTFAYWATPTVTIPAGQTSVNATLNGRNAGTTTVTASDSSRAVYAAASAVVKVTANMRLTATSYTINATDVTNTQVLLSDPSPAGGTYVTFSYSTQGIAAVSPDPAFIPTGQLAADIQIRGLAGGSTTITPVATGVNGQSSGFTAYAPVLTLNTTQVRLGMGQYDPNLYVYTPTYTNVSVPVTLANSDTVVATAPASVTIPGGSYYAYFNVAADSLGTAVITPSATGWTAANALTVIGTTPWLGTCCGGTYNTTSPQTSITVYAEDSLRSAHYRTSSLVVRLHSTDTTVMRVIDTLVTVQPGNYYTTGRIIPGGMGGTAYVVATASGHVADSSLYTVVGPKLNLSWSTLLLGQGQYEPNTYVYSPDNVTAPLVVTLANSNPTAVGTPAADTIPQGTYYTYFPTRGLAADTATIIASAPGYQPDTAYVRVSTPRLTACCNGTYNNFGPGGSLTVYSTDSLGNARYRLAPLSVTVTSLDPTIISVDSATVTIDSGWYYNNRARFRPVGVGTARVVFTAAGHTASDTIRITVQTPKIQFSIGTAQLGRRQRFDPNGSGFYVHVPDNRTSPLAVTITQTSPATDSLTATSLTIDSAMYYRYLDAMGLANGRDTLIVSAPGYLPDTAVIIVSTPRLTNCCMPGSATTTNPPFSMTVYTTDSSGTAHYSMDTVVVHAVVSDSAVIRPVASQEYFRILPNAYYGQAQVSVIGPGSASITYSDSAGSGYQPTTSGTITVTGPSLSLNNAAPMLGMRQNDGGGSYVNVPNNVASDLVVRLVSTSTQVVTVPDSVVIPAGSYYAYFQVTAMDTVGTIQVQATATGYSAASMNVQVTQPRFLLYTPGTTRTTSGPQYIDVYAADANGTVHYTNEDVVVTLTSSATAVAAIDSTTVTIPAGSYYSYSANWAPGVVGTAQLTASDARAAYYKYNSGTANVQVITPSLYLYGPGSLGIGQYYDYAQVSTYDYMASDVSVAFSHSGAARTATTANLSNTPISGVTIGTGQYYTYFRMAGVTSGTDSLVASLAAPNHLPDTLFTSVGQGRVDPLSGWPTSLAAGDSVLVTVYTRAPDQSQRNVVAATTFTLTPNANIEFRQGGAVVTTVTVPADASQVQFYVKGVAAGTGTISITNSDYVTYTNSVTVTP